MGLYDVVTNTAIAVQVSQTVISGMGYPPNLQGQLAD